MFLDVVGLTLIHLGHVSLLLFLK